MTTQEYIEAVKVKLEEISPFLEPTSFIAAGDDSADVVKPIISYITNTLDEATRNCLRALPLSLLHADVEVVTPTITIAADGVGTFNVTPSTRYVRFRHTELKRDITSFITTEDSLYLLQQNQYTRGGQAKPVAVLSSNESKMEIYSLASSSEGRTDNANGKLLKIDLTKKPGSDATNHILSPIEDFIVLECAALVSDILGNAAAAQACRQELQIEVQSVLQ